MDLIRSRITRQWLLLVTLTLCSAELLQHLLGNWGKLPLFAAILAIAFAKVRIVGLDFMELRSAPLPLRLMFEGWVILVGVTMVLMLAGVGTSS